MELKRQEAIKAGIKKAHKEADQLKALTDATLQRMAAERRHRENNSFAATVAILSLLLMILAGSGAALMFGG